MWFKKETKYIYVVVRKDIPVEDQMVQVGHACFDAGKKFGLKGVHLVLLEVENVFDLHSLWDDMENAKIQYCQFWEDNLVTDYLGFKHEMGYTAFCTQPISGKKRQIFANYPLWKYQK